MTKSEYAVSAFLLLGMSITMAAGAADSPQSATVPRPGNEAVTPGASTGAAVSDVDVLPIIAPEPANVVSSQGTPAGVNAPPRNGPQGPASADPAAASKRGGAPSAAGYSVASSPQTAARATYPTEGMLRIDGGNMQVAGYHQPPAQPTQPLQPLPPEPPTPEATGRAPEAGITESIRAILAGWSGAPSSVATAGPTQSANVADTGGLLSQSDAVQNVEVQRRSQVSLDPHIRGYKWGQIYAQADGAFWTPARLDLDTMLSKIDPGMIQDVTIVPGPYGLRFGPGLAYIDVNRAPTPRYADGPQTHFDTTGNLRSNGGQLYGRATAFGGGSNYGFRFSYGDRKGSDYTAGNGQSIPSSYHNQDSWGELSYDLNPHRRFDVAFQRLDQTNTEYPCQFFDINFLGTYGFQTRITDEDPNKPWTKLTAEGWYNQTEFNGDTHRKYDNPDYPVIQRVNTALEMFFGTAPLALLGSTRGELHSGGGRGVALFGERDGVNLSVGADVRYVGQFIREDYVLTGAMSDTFSTNMPHAWMTNPGIFAEWSKPMNDVWRLSVGARGDYVQTTARAADVQPGSDLVDLVQDDFLYHFYVTNQWKANEHWTFTGAFGQGQRPPTLVERYADGLFLSILQSGFTRVIGDTHLAPERDWQVDVGVNAEFDRFRGRAEYFFAWVQDYVTLQDDTVGDPQFSDARLVRFTNTPLATLNGFAVSGEYDWLPRVSPFGRISYVQGQDETLGAPLPAIPPLESTVGLRLHDTEKGRRWGVELGARMVAIQNRLGALRLQGIDTATVVEERTPGFTVCHLRAYWNCKKNLHLIAGAENLFGRNYQEHLDLRLRSTLGGAFPTATRVWEPGFSPYFGLNWVY